jgi:hypothetical protein
MKQILAIAIGILMMGSDASEAKEITGKAAENIIVKGKIIGSFVQGGATMLVIYKNQYYHCRSRIITYPGTSDSFTLKCWSPD